MLTDRSRRELVRRLGALVRARVDAGMILGVALAVTDGEQTVWADGFGRRSIEIAGEP